MSKTFESKSARWIHVNDFYKSPRIPIATRVSVEIMSADERVYVTQLKLTEFLKTYHFEGDINDSLKVNLSYFPIFIEEYTNPEYFDIITRDKYRSYEYEPCEINSTLLNEF